MFIVLFCSLISFTSIVCMDLQTHIITSDRKEYILPQWKIEASRLLQRKQELQKAQEKYYGIQPALLTLKTINAEKLDLFSDALDAMDFPLYFGELTPYKQYLL